jgi:hypothetical protein
LCVQQVVFLGECVEEVDVQPPIHTVDLSSLLTEIEHHRQEHQPHAASSFNQASWLHLIIFFIAIGIFWGIVVLLVLLSLAHFISQQVLASSTMQFRPVSPEGMRTSSPSFRPASPADMSSSPVQNSCNSARNSELGAWNPQFTQYEQCLHFFRE